MSGEDYNVHRVLGEGAFARVYCASTCGARDTSDLHVVALKVQKPACPWEYYICAQLRERLNKAGLWTFFVRFCAAALCVRIAFF
jgi:checkpoint serine/threonine-protein kinase